MGQPPAAWDLTDVAMTTPERGFAVGKGLMAGEGSYVLETVDGGMQFRQLFFSLQPVVGMAAPDAQHAYLLESDYVTNGEYTAKLQEVAGGTGAPVTLWKAEGFEAEALSFPTDQVGFITATAMQGVNPAGKTHLYATHDGGGTWTSLPLPCGSPSGAAIDFTDPLTGWLLCGGDPGVSSQDKALYRTSDGGQTWSEVASTGPGGTSGSLPITGYVYGIFFPSSSVGYIVLARKGVLKTTDGGKTWAEAFQNVLAAGNDQALSVGFLPGGFGWLLAGLGPPLLVTQDGGATWQQTYPRPAPQGPISDLGSGDAIGLETAPVPRLVETSDGGAEWTASAPLPFTPRALQALSLQVLVAAEGSGVELSQDGGRHWTAVDLPAGWSPQSLGYATPSEGWVVASDQASQYGIFACTAQTCTQVATPFTPSLAQATGPDAGIAVGKDAKGRAALFTTTDGGTRWTERILPSLFVAQGGGPSIMGLGAKGDLRWLYSGSGILRSYDGGTTWEEIRWGPEIVSLGFADPLHALLVTYGASGTRCWQTTDGGTTFTWAH